MCQLLRAPSSAHLKLHTVIVVLVQLSLKMAKTKQNQKKKVKSKTTVVMGLAASPALAAKRGKLLFFYSTCILTVEKWINAWYTRFI